MSFLTSLLSDIDPTAAARVATPPPTASGVTPRPATTSRATSAQPAKRKAEGQPEGAQTKIQRKDVPAIGLRTNGAARPAGASNGASSKPTTPTSSIPYRGTAAAAGSTPAKTVNTVAKRPGTAPTPAKIDTASKPAPPSTNSPTKPISAMKKPGSYAAMLAKAREAQASKSIVPTVKHAPTKILTKKERLALAAEAKLGAKGKVAGPNGQLKAENVKGADAGKDKRKPTEITYQGTARPKQPAEIGYKGTAKSSGPGLGAKSTATAAPGRVKPKADRGKYGGYASWSDEELDEEEDYASDASSDMEGGLWDVEEEETRALAVARKEDAEALAEEERHKREKEARRRKLEAMSKAMAAKPKKY